MTESRASRPERTAGAAAKRAAKRAAKPVRAAGARARSKTATTLAAASKLATAPAYRHPNLGLPPIDVTSGHRDAAGKLRDGAARISAAALEAAIEADPTIRARFDEAGLRRLLHDGELLTERLSICVAGEEVRWLAEYADWIGPIYRRRGVPLGDLGSLCDGIRETVEPLLDTAERRTATRALDAAAAIFKRNGRIAGDRHKRNALWKWMYRGV